MNYHLALNPGSTSLGWAMAPTNRKALAEPCATVKAGVRIFPMAESLQPRDKSAQRQRLSAGAVAAALATAGASDDDDE